MLFFSLNNSFYLEGQAKKEAEKLALKGEKNGKRKLSDDQDQDDGIFEQLKF